MTAIALLEALRARAEVILSGLWEENKNREWTRPAVYMLHLPDKELEKPRVPYVLVQFAGARDFLDEHRERACEIKARFVVAAYNPENPATSLGALEILERLRVGLLRFPLVADRFTLDEAAGIEREVYAADEPPYFFGALRAVYRAPAVDKEL